MTGPDEVAILRIELEDIEPLIWRRVAVPTSMNLKALHRVIQAAMGWLDYHLWEFTAGEHKYGMLVPNDPDWNERIKDAGKTKLSALLTIGVREMGYVYDMGDNWQHRIIVEKLKACRTWIVLSAVPRRGEAVPARGLRRLSRLLRILGQYCQQTTARSGEPPSSGMGGRIIRMISASRK